MVQKKMKKAQWLWQDYVGARWNNLEWANTGDDKASYVYPQGKNSKSAYRPKSLFYHYQMDGIDGNKYKLDSVKWVLVIGKYNVQKNNLPTIKVFVGDNNAPYKKDPIKKISAHKLLDNYFDFDHYTMQFDLTGVTISQLKNLIIEVDFEKTKTTESSTVSVNRARLVVDYSPKDPKFSIYDSVSTTSANTNEKINWKLTVKNTGYSGSETVTLSLPKNMAVASSNGGGTYNNSTKTWSTGTLAKNGTVTRTFQLKSTTVGSKTLKATQNSNDVTNKVLTRQVNFTKPPSKPVSTVVANRKDKITIYTYDTFEKESYQYFDVEIQGYSENHSTSQTCYEITTSENVDLYLPVKDNAELIEENINVNNIITNISGDGTERLLCLSIVPNKDFVANVRVYIYCNDDDVGSVTIRDVDNRTFTETFDILPRRKHFFITDVQTSRDKQYVMNSVNIGSPNNWTIRAKASKKNFFEEKRTNFAISIEDLIAYVGVVPLTRCHKADVTATSKNTLIENRYLNRAYYGKKGDYSEDIKMTLRLHWTDVATLQGLCEMDKPIPIDTIPYFADGDPLNHRGWAELSEVSNIKKINDMLYECDLKVTYLTHNILTMFGITDGKKITENAIKFYLSLTHNYNEDMLDLFRLNYYEFFSTIEDVNGDMFGEYNIPSSANLTFNSTKEINRYSTYDLIYRNQLPSLYSEDYDGNWEMAVRVLNQKDRTVLFEHKYNNFQHYDRNTTNVLNKADVTTTVRNGDNVEVVNYDTIGLGFDELAPLVEDRKIATHFNTMDNISVNEFNQNFELFLLDNNNDGIANQTVKVRITDNDNYSERFDVLTDIWGRLSFPCNFGNGLYNVEVRYDETDTYRACDYNTTLNIQLNEVTYHFEYQDAPTVYQLNQLYTLKLLDSSNNGVADIVLDYSFKDIGDEEYSYERQVTTDSNGEATIPIDWDNGSKILRVIFKGYQDGNTIYQPVMMEEQVNINIRMENVKIQADDLTMVQGDNQREYNIILSTQYGTVLGGETVNIAFYNKEHTFLRSVTTNAQGVAKTPIYLPVGVWNVDVHYSGNLIFNPCIAQHTITIESFEHLGTDIESNENFFNENKILNGTQDYYTIRLYDDNDVGIPNQLVNVKVYDSTKTTTYVDTVLRTREDGKARLPFITHSEEVVIESKFIGTAKYGASENEDRVIFEAITKEVSQTLGKDVDETFGDIVTLTKGGVTTEEFDDSVTIISNENMSSDFDFVAYDEYTRYTHDNLPKDDSKVTVLVKGDVNTYSICRTFAMSRLRDSRPSLAWWVRNMTDGETDEIDMTHEVIDGNGHIDDLFNIRFYLNCWIPNNTVVHLYSDYVSDESYDKHYTALTKETTNENGRKISYFDVYGLYDSNTTWRIRFDDSGVLKPFTFYTYTIDASATTKSATTLTVDGFGYNNETLQNLTLNATNSNADWNAKISEYYIAKVTNTTNYEELYYFGYLVDNSTDSNLKFTLPKGSYKLEVFTKDSTNYKGAYYTTTATITTESTITIPILTNITDEDYWVDLNEDSPTIADGTISTEFGDYQVYSMLNTEFTSSNHYALSFKVNPYGYTNYGFCIGSDFSFDNFDGLFISNQNIQLYSDGVLMDSATPSEPMEQGVDNDVVITRNNNTFTVIVNEKVWYSADLPLNIIGVWDYNAQGQITLSDFELSPYSSVDITPSVDEYDEIVFGSDLHLEIRNDHLNLVDYGMLPTGSYGGGKIILDDISIPSDVPLELEMEIDYNNTRFQRLNDLQGKMQMRVYEDVSTAESSQEYSKLLCSPMPIPNAKTIFTRHTEDGTLYYVEIPNDYKKPSYLCNAYTQYKGGCEIKSETGISLFNLDNAYSPVYVGNGLVRAEFHRRTGYIALSRYDDNTDIWYLCNILKLADNPKLQLLTYNDDKVELKFGRTTWKFYRGRPFIVVNHEKDDFRILNLVDRVYCETIENNRAMGFIEEHNTMMSVFNPQLSIQQFRQELHIGENIRTDNFKLYDVDSDGYLTDLETDAWLSTTEIDNESALVVTKNRSGKLALNFPSESSYVKKPSDTFSLLIGTVNSTNETSVTVKARGFDDKGAVPVRQGIQYGVWEQSKTVSIDTLETDEIRVTFSGCPSEVKYIDFVVILNANTTSEVELKDFMVYDGDAIINHDVDTSRVYANQVQVLFTDTYYAELYDDDAPCGLGIIRPNQKSFSLRTLTKDTETVLVPFMKKCSEYDKVEQVFLEYLNSKEQTIDILWDD